MSTISPPYASAAASAAGLEFAANGDAAVHATSQTPSAFARRWWPLGLGLAAILLSTSVRFAHGYWSQPEFEHEPLMLAAALWLLWRERGTIFAARAPDSVLGATALIVVSLLVYVLGARLKSGYVEFGAVVALFAGALALLGGRRLVWACAFSLIFLCLAIPLPSPLIFAATSGLKEWVSLAAEGALHLAGYPIARDGVILRIGSYNLLLADACSGMNSLISLSAVGLLYLRLTTQRHLAHTLLLLASILPIAVATNIVRVLILVLITYHLGDAAGQGFLHEFSGFVMFLVALLLLALVDFLLGRVFHQSAARQIVEVEHVPT